MLLFDKDSLGLEDLGLAQPYLGPRLLVVQRGQRACFDTALNVAEESFGESYGFLPSGYCVHGCDKAIIGLFYISNGTLNREKKVVLCNAHILPGKLEREAPGIDPEIP